jgi:hypothetical protein
MAHPGTLSRNLALLACLWLTAHTARAQETEPILSRNTFEIPLTLLPGAPPKQIILYSSRDGRPYRRAATVGPNATHFPFTAKKDGWYSFIVQTEDFNGRRIPATIEGRRPDKRVCVDTTRPEITLYQVQLKPGTPAPEGRIAVEWGMKDENLDLNSMELSYRASDGEWTVLHPDKLDRAHFHFRPNGTAPYQVKLRVSDRAGNISVKEVKIAGAAVVPTGREKRSPGSHLAPTSPGTLGPKSKFVRTKRFCLHYRVSEAGRSGVKEIQVWMTRNKTSYQLHDTIEKPTGKYEVTVNAQGRWGFVLVPVSGVGRCRKEPEVGQEPDIWVEVDEKPPQVFIQKVDLTESPADGGTITVRYLATDTFLRARPITVWYRDVTEKGKKERAGWEEWPGAKGLENKGVVVLSTKDMPYQFDVRVTAVDEAGNQGEAVWSEPVTNDTKTPKITLDDVKPVETPGAAVKPGPGAGGPSGPPGSLPPSTPEEMTNKAPVGDKSRFTGPPPTIEVKDVAAPSRTEKTEKKPKTEKKAEVKPPAPLPGVTPMGGPPGADVPPPGGTPPPLPPPLPPPEAGPPGAVPPPLPG